MVILLCDGVLVSNSLCGGASIGGSRSLSKVFDLVSQRAIVTGEWYIPGHKLRGFLVEELESFPLREPSNGEIKVEKMGIGVGVVGEEMESSIKNGFLIRFWRWVPLMSDEIQLETLSSCLKLRNQGGKR